MSRGGLIVRSLVSTLVLVMGSICAVSASASAAPTAHSVATADGGCSRMTSGSFKPVAVSVPSVGKVKVTARPGYVAAPPLTTSGKAVFGWGKAGTRASAAKYHLLLSAHAWPDNSALGNKLNATLRDGDVVKVLGARGQVQCYRISLRRVAEEGPGLRKLYFGDDSKHRLAILTCAGERLGPGRWTLRSVWIGRPIA